MNNNKRIGVWMDHSTANLIDPLVSGKYDSIHSMFTFEAQEEALSRSEKTMHNKRQQLLESFYTKIAAEVLKNEHVLLFGPTNAKTELHNYLKKDSHFKDIKIDVVAADKMTDNELHAFVKRHFEA